MGRFAPAHSLEVTMRMVCLKEFRYAGKQLLPGDEFDARPADVRVLKAIKNANLADSEEGGEVLQSEKTDKPDSGRRTYKRRDMKAE